MECKEIKDFGTPCCFVEENLEADEQGYRSKDVKLMLYFKNNSSRREYLEIQKERQSLRIRINFYAKLKTKHIFKDLLDCLKRDKQDLDFLN
jgi:hypothetical protein